MSALDPLEHLMQDAASAGKVLDQGAFSVDPYRAVEILRGQGRLGQNSLLYLLSAIYTHTGGHGVRRFITSGHFGSCRFLWSKDLGVLPASIESLLAEEALRVNGVRLSAIEAGVRLDGARMGGKDPAALFEEVAPRLKYYPWAEEPSTNELLAAFDEEQICGGFVRQEHNQGYFLQVVRGISYPVAWQLPVDAVCYDAAAKADISLTSIPDSARTEKLMRLFADRFNGFLKEMLAEAKPCRLNPYRELVGELPLFAAFLGYVVYGAEDAELLELTSHKVFFMDAASREWSLAELLKAYGSFGKMLVVSPNANLDAVSGASLDRPVLIWGGQAQRIGGQVFLKTASGDGYLYSLLANARERLRLEEQGEPLLATIDIPGGRLGLLPWGAEDRLAEIEYVGARRSRETYYLNADAPKGMRIQWESDGSLEETVRELNLEGPLRQSILELLSKSIAVFSPPAPTLLVAITWGMALGSLDWSKLETLAATPIFELADGGLASLNLCFKTIEEQGKLPVLEDRSSSLPQEVPHLLFWQHPLFKALDMDTVDRGYEMRQAYFKERGRQSWLSAHNPKEPDWPPEPVLDKAQGHKRIRIARAQNQGLPTQILFWREGRAFGRRSLDTSQCPPGWLVLWWDDEIEGDSYWSGPSAAALSEVQSIVATSCQDIASFGSP